VSRPMRTPELVSPLSLVAALGMLIVVILILPL
jgi:hypothetical protein